MIGAKAKLRVKLTYMILREIRAYARVTGANPASDDYEALAERIAIRLEGDIKLPIHKDQILLVDDDKNGGYTNPRIVEWVGSAEEMLYPEDPATGWPVEDRVADYAITLPLPEALPEL